MTAKGFNASINIKGIISLAEIERFNYWCDNFIMRVNLRAENFSE